MAWPSGSVAIGDIITAAQLNLLPIQIADSTAATSVASFDFTSLPQQFAHLKIVIVGRGDTAAAATSLAIRFNNDSGANYASERITGNAATLVSAEFVSQTASNPGYIAAATATASHAGSCEIIVPGYAQTTLFKEWNSIAGYTTAITTTGITAETRSGVWASTAAINRFTVLPVTGNFVAGSRCTIYGWA